MVASGKYDKKGAYNKQEIDRFKFSVTLLTAFGTILYVVYNYIQNNAITNDGIYRLIKSILEFSIVSSFFFIIYLSFIGASVGAQGTLRKCLLNWASKIYSITFIIMAIELMKTVIFLMFSSDYILFSSGDKIYMIYSMMGFLVPKIIIFVTLPLFIIYIIFEKKFRLIFYCYSVIGLVVSFLNLYHFIIIFIIFIPFSLIIRPHSIKFKDLIKSNRNSINLAVIFIICGIFINLNYNIIDRFPEYITVGQVDFNMESIFHKSDKLVPASINIKGTNYFINVSLFKEDFNHTLIDNIRLSHPESAFMWNWILNQQNPTTNLTEFGKNNSTLVGTVLDKQSYNIFINTKNLNEGYYLLVITPSNGKDYSKGFYLLNQ